MDEIKEVWKQVGAVFVFSFFTVATTVFLYSMFHATSSQRVLGRGSEKAESCTTIQDGTLTTEVGEPVEVGFDEWGYNYQARIFSGTYCDAYRDADWCQPFKGVNLSMKWNDAWISNKDCDADGKLDRHSGHSDYKGSGAWLTNHMWGSYLGDDAREHNWSYFVKIVAVPSGAELVDGVWYTPDGGEIGPEIWGQFAVIEEIYNDPYAGSTGVETLSPTGPGLGRFNSSQTRVDN